MFWIFRTKPVTIPSELHEKFASKNTPIEEVPSEVIAVRPVTGSKPARKEQDALVYPYYGTGA